MPEVFHYRNLLVKNFRSFSELNIEEFCKFNIIGGENGVGKSSLLEAGFHLADRGNISTLFNDFGWRSVPLTTSDFPIAFKQITNLGNIKDPVIFQGGTTRGQFTSKYQYGPQIIEQQTLGGILQNPSQKASSSENTSIGSSAGFKLVGHKNSDVDLNVSVQFNLQGLFAQALVSRFVPFSTCMMVNSVTRKPGGDQAERFSTIVRDGKIKDIMSFIHLVNPTISELQLLNIGGAPLIHARVQDSIWVPLPLLGEGASDLFTIALFMVSAENGIIFLDEFDSVVHHSLLDKLWNLILSLATKFNVQVFATTHSRESLKAAVRAAEVTKLINEFKYYRLRRDKKYNVKSVAYDGKNLQDSINENWEIR